MTRILRGLFFWGVLLGLGPVARAQGVLKKDLLEMSAQMETRIQSRIRSLLGADSRVVVGVYVREKTLPTSSASAGGHPWQVVGPYATPGAYGAEGASSIEIDLVEVKVQIEKSFGDKYRAEVEALTKDALKGVKSNVQVLANLEPLRKAEPVDERGILERFLDTYKNLIPLLGSIILLAGIVALGVMLRSASGQLSDGIKSIRPASAPSASDAPRTIMLSEGDGQGLNKRPSLPPPPGRAADVRKNLELIETYITDQPVILKRSLGDGSADLLGLKFLITRLPPAAKDKIREILGMATIVKVQEYQAQDDVVGFDANGWLQQLAEKLELSKMIGGSVVEEALSGEQALWLSGTDADQFIGAAVELNNSAVWRLATEFLPMDVLRAKMKDYGEEVWLEILQASGTSDAEEIKRALQALQSKLRAGPSGGAVIDIKSQRAKVQHFSQKLLPALADAVLSKPFGEDDAFLERLMTIAPEFASLMHERVWTPSRLTTIKESQLKEIFLKLDNDQKSTLIFILPEPHKSVLTAFLPEGNGRRIVTDTVTKLGQREASVEEREKQTALAREFLDYLRTLANAGKIKVNQPESSSEEGASIVKLPANATTEPGSAKVDDPSREAS